MSLLSRHLEQIALSSESIATLPFPQPKIFTNALLSTSDITSLIRDTEPHERALFSVPPPPQTVTSSTPYTDPKASSNRRQTVFNVAQGEVTAGNTTGSRAPRRNTAVAAVLGAELHNEVRKTEGKGEFDIEVLLRGAEKLNAVYEVRGTAQRIAGLRDKYARVSSSVEHYERKVAKQTRDLEKMNRGERWESGAEDEEDEEAEYEGNGGEDDVEITDEDLRREEEEIRELERKKKALEERVSGMERDLGGLLR